MILYNILPIWTTSTTMCLFAHSAARPWPLASHLPTMVFPQDHCLLSPLPGMVFLWILWLSFLASFNPLLKSYPLSEAFSRFLQRKKKKSMPHNTVAISIHCHTAVFSSRASFHLLCTCVLILCVCISLLLPLEHASHESEGFVYLQLHP